MIGYISLEITIRDMLLLCLLLLPGVALGVVGAIVCGVKWFMQPKAAWAGLALLFFIGLITLDIIALLFGANVDAVANWYVQDSGIFQMMLRTLTRLTIEIGLLCLLWQHGLRKGTAQ